MAARRRSSRSKSKPGDGKFAFAVMGSLTLAILWCGSSWHTIAVVGAYLGALVAVAGSVFWWFVLWQSKRAERATVLARAGRRARQPGPPRAAAENEFPAAARRATGVYWGPIDDGDGYRPRGKRDARHDIHEPIEPEEPLASTFEEDEAATIIDFLNGDIDCERYKAPRPRRRRSPKPEGVFFNEAIPF
jgi:hypothetical protein